MIFIMGIGPSTKETTLHHFQDPLVDILSGEDEFDFLGIIVVGTPQDNEDKLFVGTRAAVWAEAMRADGAIISADGWGNSDVDFANTIEQLSVRGIPTVGVNFVGTVAGFVVTNEYMDTIVDMNKSDEGIETEVLGENSVTELEARKAAAFLKLKMRRKL